MLERRDEASERELRRKEVELRITCSFIAATAQHPKQVKALLKNAAKIELVPKTPEEKVPTTDQLRELALGVENAVRD